MILTFNEIKQPDSFREKRTENYIGTIPNNKKGKEYIRLLRFLLRPYCGLWLGARAKNRVQHLTSLERKHDPRKYQSNIPYKWADRFDVYLTNFKVGKWVTTKNDKYFNGFYFNGFEKVPKLWTLTLEDLRKLSVDKGA